RPEGAPKVIRYTNCGHITVARPQLARCLWTDSYIRSGIPWPEFVVELAKTLDLPRPHHFSRFLCGSVRAWRREARQGRGNPRYSDPRFAQLDSRPASHGRRPAVRRRGGDGVEVQADLRRGGIDLAFAGRIAEGAAAVGAGADVRSGDGESSQGQCRAAADLRAVRGRRRAGRRASRR